MKAKVVRLVLVRPVAGLLVFLRCTLCNSHRAMGASQSDTASGDDLLARIKAQFMTVDKDLARSLGGVFLFNVIQGRDISSWTMDLNKVVIYDGEPEEDPDATFTLTESTLRRLAQGREPARAVVAAGKCSVTGDIMRAMKLEPYIKLD